MSDQETPLLIDERDGVAWLTMNRPERLNALNAGLTDALRTYFQGLEDRADIRVVVLQGAGRGYCAGLDLKDRTGAAPREVQQGLAGQKAIRDIMIAMRECPQPTISIVLGALVWWRHGAWPVLTRRQWGALALCALLMVYANQICFAGGMARWSAANSALIMALSPLASSLLAALAFGERLSWQRLLGVAAGFAGVAVVVLQRPGSALASAGWGDLMLVGGVFSFAAGGVIVQRVVRNLDPLVLSLVIYGLGTVMLVLHGVVEDPQRLQPQRLFPGAWPWAMVLFSAIGATALCNWVWNGAIGRLGVARASQYQYWVPRW